jgi:hypothetical protein
VRGQIGEERFADVHFHELNADPVQTIARAYERLEIPFTAAAERAIGVYADAHPRGRLGEHRYRLEDFCLDARACTRRSRSTPNAVASRSRDEVSDSSARDRVLSGEAWSEFCRAIEQVGRLIQDPRAPFDPLDRTEGYRFLMRLVRYGFESFLEFNDPLHPELHRGSHETIKIIHENPDNLYLGARVDGSHAYRVSGTLGTARWTSFNIHAGAFGAGGRGTAHALDARELVLGVDRRFELFLGGERRGSNWLPLPPDAGSLIVRQTLPTARASGRRSSRSSGSTRSRRPRRSRPRRWASRSRRLRR